VIVPHAAARFRAIAGHPSATGIIQSALAQSESNSKLKNNFSHYFLNTKPKRSSASPT
jgi:hypothetical protein